MTQRDFIPPEPTGNSNEATFMRWVWRVCRRKIQSTPSIRVNEKDGNIYLESRITPVTAAASGLNYAGDWTAKAYPQNTIVRKRTGTNAGLYISIRAATAADIPTYPEPVSDPAWHWWNFMPVAYTEASTDPVNTYRTIYVPASDQF